MKINLTKKFSQLALTVIFALFFFSTACFAYMGSSAGYRLDIADITNSGSSGNSSNYGLSTGIVGDHQDGKSISTNYRLCAGFVEEADQDADGLFDKGPEHLHLPRGTFQNLADGR